MLLFLFLIVPLMVWFIPFSQLKARPHGSRWFLWNFGAMLATTIGSGVAMHLADLQREVIVAVEVGISVVWALVINVAMRRF